MESLQRLPGAPDHPTSHANVLVVSMRRPTRPPAVGRTCGAGQRAWHYNMLIAAVLFDRGLASCHAMTTVTKPPLG